MRTILLLFPTGWDARQLAACRDAWAARFEVRYAEPSDDACPARLPILEYIEQVAGAHGGRIHGVTSSSDYPGAAVAGAVAERLRLAGSPPDAVLRCSHKYYSRRAQREVVPEATPWFVLLDPRDPDRAEVRFPCFVKPVKGTFSILSRRIDDPEDLRAFLESPAVGEFTEEYVGIFDRLVERYTDFRFGGRYFLAEELLSGTLVTVEGFAFEGAVEIFGIVDSLLHPEMGSFARFDYPSALPRPVQDRMGEIARRTIRGLGLRTSMFNIEMIHDPARDSIHIVEVNPRISGQFGDLYQKVDGASSYEFLLALAAGERPSVPRRKGTFASAASVPLRTFRPCRVRRAPGEGERRRLEAAHPGALIWSECSPGQQLQDFDRGEDGRSARYAVLNLGGRDRQDVAARAAALQRELGFDLEPLDRAGPCSPG